MDFTFELNDQPMSALKFGAIEFPAFSGLKAHVNKRASICLMGNGPIPVGTYYILDRPSGGTLGPFRDLFNGRRDWFALYADDGHMDDHTFCSAVQRGHFRLHPKGVTGRSEGCIVLESAIDFHYLRAALTSRPATTLPGSQLKAYGRVIVK